MIRRLDIAWPDPRPFAGRNGQPIRFLATSDIKEPALEYAPNRESLGTLDGILGCGDLDPAWLSFLGDAFNAPIVYVRGNHDRGGEWEERPLRVPVGLEAGRVNRLCGIAIVGLGWPGVFDAGNRRRPWLAWRQAGAIARRALRNRLLGRREPFIVISHVPPAGIGDAADAYHRGFGAYRWLLGRLRPPIWIHGHTTTASVSRLVEHTADACVANATGALLVELHAPAWA